MGDLFSAEVFEQRLDGRDPGIDCPGGSTPVDEMIASGDDMRLVDLG